MSTCKCNKIKICFHEILCEYSEHGHLSINCVETQLTFGHQEKTMQPKKHSLCNWRASMCICQKHMITIHPWRLCKYTITKLSLFLRKTNFWRENFDKITVFISFFIVLTALTGAHHKYSNSYSIGTYNYILNCRIYTINK